MAVQSSWESTKVIHRSSPPEETVTHVVAREATVADDLPLVVDAVCRTEGATQGAESGQAIHGSVVVRQRSRRVYYKGGHQCERQGKSSGGCATPAFKPSELVYTTAVKHRVPLSGY